MPVPAGMVPAHPCRLADVWCWPDAADTDTWRMTHLSLTSVQAVEHRGRGSDVPLPVLQGNTVES